MLFKPLKGKKVKDKKIYDDAFSKYLLFAKKIVPMTAFTEQICRYCMPLIHFKKGEVIYHAGDIHHSGYYISSGLCRSYLISDTGKEITWEFYFNDKNSSYLNLIAGDYNSFIQDKPSNLYIEVLEDTYCFEFKNEGRDFIFKMMKTPMTFAKFLCQEYNKEMLNRYLDLNTSADDKVEKFFQNKGFLLEKVSQNQIASYLGITHETFSRLKKRYS